MSLLLPVYHYRSLRVLSVVIVIFVVALVLIQPAAVAARDKKGTRATGAIDAKTFEVLTAAQEKTTAGDYAEAIRLLDSVRGSDKLNSYARSQMWNFYAFIYATQEKYKEAITYYQKVITEKDAPDGLKLTSKYTLAQLYFQIEDYAAVIDLMEQWLQEIEKPTTTAHVMLAQAYYQTKKMDKALQNIDEAMRLEKAEGKPPKEEWLNFKVAIYFAKEDLPAMLKAYRTLFEYYPRMRYLRQIVGLYGELELDLKRITTFDAIYLYGGLSSESDILNLAYMYLGQELPYKAGRIIEKGLQEGKIAGSTKNIEVLAGAWAQANEHKKAIPALEKAASISDKGLLYARLAGVYFDAGEFQQAAQAARLAAKKGGLKKDENNQMLLGMALFNSKQYEDALQAFRQAKKTSAIFGDARKWEQYTLAEIERLQALEEGQLKLKERTEETLSAQENNAEALGARMLSEDMCKNVPMKIT